MASLQIEVDSLLVRLCIESATDSAEAVERWRMQRRTLERLPSPLAGALFHRLLHRRLLYPSLLEIFKFCLEEIDLRGENSVDAEWMAYIGGFSYLRSLNLADCHRITNSSLWPIAGMSSLKYIDLSRCNKVSDAGIKHLLSTPNLEKLHIAETAVTANGIMLLSSLENLVSLDLGGLPVSDVVLNSLKVLTKLEYLDIWGSKITDSGMVVLKNFPKLSSLNLCWTNVTTLPNLKILAYLNMSHCTINSVLEAGGYKAPLNKLILHGASFKEVSDVFSFVDDSSLSLLDISNTSVNHFGIFSGMLSLEHLDISFGMLGDDSVEQIAKIGTNLRYLNLNGMKVSSGGIATLAGHVPNLTFISLSQTLVDDSSIAYISMMPKLQTIDLSNTSIRGFIPQAQNDEDENENENEALSLLPLDSLKHLERLDLSGTQLTDPALCPLSRFQELNHLSLKSASLTDDCLPYLASIKNLGSLSIQDSLLTNSGLESFFPQPTLSVLDLRGCWLLTGEALMMYHQNHPQIEVRHELFYAHSVVGLRSHINGSLNKRVGSSSSVPKQKGVKSLLSSMVFKKDILDQRIKYDRNELLALQHSASEPPSLPSDVGPFIPEVES